MYKVVIKPLSDFKSNLTSITIFGAIVNAMAYTFDTEVIDWIASGEYKLIVSNIYPENYLPISCYELENIEDNSVIRYEFDRNIRDRKGYSGRFESQTNCYNGNLWFLIDTDFDKADIEKILRAAFINGIGAQRSIGKGQFEIVEISEFDESKLNCKDANAYITLSDYIPNEDDSTIGNFETRIIRSRTTDGMEKAPVYCINAGSKFAGKTEENVIGRIVKDEATKSLISGQSFIRKFRYGV